jgi:hypothetical protein
MLQKDALTMARSSPIRERTHMAITRTAGILTYGDGKRMIDKEHRGVRLFRRLGRVTQEEAGQLLDREIDRLA